MIEANGSPSSWIAATWNPSRATASRATPVTHEQKRRARPGGRRRPEGAGKVPDGEAPSTTPSEDVSALKFRCIVFVRSCRRSGVFPPR
jgi:hypothetical protein